MVKGLVKTSTPALKDCEGCEDPTQIIKRTGERRVEVESNIEVEKNNNPIKGKISDESSHSSLQSPETAHTENQSDTQNPSPTLHQPFTIKNNPKKELATNKLVVKPSQKAIA